MGRMFPHCWQGCPIWHCSWLVGGLHPTPVGSTLVWAEKAQSSGKRREMAVVIAPKFEDITDVRDGCVLNPQKGRHGHTNPAHSQMTALGQPSGPCECYGHRLQSLPDPQNHVIFITDVPEMKGEEINSSPLWRQIATNTGLSGSKEAGGIMTGSKLFFLQPNFTVTFRLRSPSPNLRPPATCVQ